MSHPSGRFDPSVPGQSPPVIDSVPVLVSVVVPVHDQEAWLPAALSSLLAQTHPSWECVVVDDGSPGDVATAAAEALEDPRVRLHRLPANTGLGAALNAGLELTTGELVAYLPADDVWSADHLETLVAALADEPSAALAVAGVRHSERLTSPGRIDGEPLQLVQVLHRRTDDRWTERSELTTDDLGRMLWDRLLERGPAVGTGRVTCTWRTHPRQRHKVLREPWGGLNAYRARYRVQEPLRLQSTVGDLHDEVAQYRRWREQPDVPRAPDGLRILLVGELAHNPERVLALHERGHELHGLWTPDPLWFNTVGPLPFGHVRDVDPDRWRDEVRELQPDVVYALLNWQTIPFAHEVLSADLGVPFVWHLKEGPFFAMQHGMWDRLVDLHTRTDGQVYSSVELRDWFAATVPATLRTPSIVLDGDLPKADLLTGERSPLLSEQDGEVHTVIAGRPLGPHPSVVGALADRGVHVHLYGEKAAAQMRDWVEEVQRLAGSRFHLHPGVSQAGWVRELSQYDAGWLHDVVSTNRGDLHAATWDDLNVPARVATYAAAGVPMVQRDNDGSAVASQTVVRERRMGVFYDDVDDLVVQLRDRTLMAELRESVWRQRSEFVFDTHADRLVDLFRQVVAGPASFPAEGQTLPVKVSQSAGSPVS